MAFIGIVLAAAFNCVALFFLSLLAAGGDGSSDGVVKVWTYGYSWIAVSSIAALLLWMRGSKGAGFAVAAMTLPTGWILVMAYLVVGTMLGFDIR